MSLSNFIKENRADIDAAIKRVNPNQQTFNDNERRLWVLNDYGLYQWAKSNRVRI